MTIHFLNPTQEAEVIPATLAPRLTTLNQCSIGLLANGKTNSSRLLDIVVEELGRTYKIGDVVREEKNNSSSNCAPEILESLANQCEAVIIAVGD